MRRAAVVLAGILCAGAATACGGSARPTAVGATTVPVPAGSPATLLTIATTPMVMKGDYLVRLGVNELPPANWSGSHPPAPWPPNGRSRRASTVWCLSSTPP